MTLAAEATTTDRVSTPLLELRDIRAAYDGINVLRGVDLVVPEATVVAVLGPNGAGKTTTLKVAAGLHPASGGDILVAGRRVNGARPDEQKHRQCKLATLAQAIRCTNATGTEQDVIIKFSVGRKYSLYVGGK